jgi:hypothetical protein
MSSVLMLPVPSAWQRLRLPAGILVRWWWVPWVFPAAGVLASHLAGRWCRWAVGS